MEDIFISYKREEKAKAEQLATILEKQGWSVWWDPNLRAGDRTEDVIQHALKNARCIISLLSSMALQSDYVMNETRYALRRKKLIPVVIESVELPFDLEGIHTPSLKDWDGDEASDDYISLIDDLSEILGPSLVQGQEKHKSQTKNRHDKDAEEQADKTSKQVENSNGVDRNSTKATQDDSGMRSQDADRVEDETTMSGCEHLATFRKETLRKGIPTKPKSRPRWFTVVAIVIVSLTIWQLSSTSIYIHEHAQNAEINTSNQQTDKKTDEGELEAVNKVMQRMAIRNPNYQELPVFEKQPTELEIEALINKASQAVNEGKYELAREMLSIVAKLDSNNPWIGELNRRMTLVKQDKQPESDLKNLPYRQSEIDALIKLASQAVNDDMYELAHEMLSIIAQLDSNNPWVGELNRRMALAEHDKQPETDLNRQSYRQSVIDALVKLASQAVIDDMYEEAHEKIFIIAQLDSNNPWIGELKRRMANAK